MHSNKSDIHDDGKCGKKVPLKKSWKQSTTKNKARIKYTSRREREEKGHARPDKNKAWPALFKCKMGVIRLGLKCEMLLQQAN